MNNIRIHIAAACAEFAAVQGRAAAACVAAFNERRSARTAREAAANDGSLGRAQIVADARAGLALRTEAEALEDLRNLQDGFAFVLRHATPANDEVFGKDE